ncbi:thioesterase II family protein [Streptomyces sp. NPDC006602]|uniref:thioesterase II family protein n=1 Tax=Streptomyces sp. NPDC006602 TaxID=3364751 RepID=UPI0036BF94DF
MDDPDLRFICFPHVGAGGAAFNSWMDHVPANVDLCVVRLPGRENRLAEPPIDDSRALFDGLEPAVAPLLDVPFALVGHCSGSVLAFELARRLHDMGKARPAMIVLSSTEAPAHRSINDPLHLLSRQELISRVVGFGGMPAAVLEDPDLMALFEPILRADYRVIERLRYSAGPPLDVPIAVIGGRHDEFVSPKAMAAWADETTADFSLHLLNTGHYLLAEAGQIIGGIVRGLLERGL